MKNFKMLSKAEMRKVAGGTLNPGDSCTDFDICPPGYSCYGGFCVEGICTVTVTCHSGTVISCSGSNGKCKHVDDTLHSVGWVQCDNDAKVMC